MGLLSRLLNRTAQPAQHPTAVRMLEGASGKRWPSTPAFGATGSEVLAGAAQVRGRARHLRFNDPTAGNGAEILKTALVGYGVTAASLSPVDRDEQDAAFNKWAEANQFGALLSEVADALVTDGESLLILRTDDIGALRLQHVPAEQLDESYSLELGEGRYIAAGIEYDADDQPIAYHFRPARPTDQYQTFRAPVRVDVADVIHIFRKLGAGQTRGLSWFAPVILPLNELSQLQDALQVNAKIQAMMCGFIIDQNGTGPNPFDSENADLDLSIEPGAMRVLPAGWDVRFSQPQQMAQAVDLVAVSLRQIAAGLQVPEFLLSGDMRGVNYSSARTALIQFRSHIEAIQHTVLVPALNRIWSRWQLLESLRGTNSADPAAPAEWHFPKPQWVDPESDAKATREMLDMGLISRRMAVAQLGYDVAQVDAEIAADRTREAELGLSFGVIKPEQTGIQS
ncbi:phage portal protein [Cereibacter azotoformans]|uniref:Lambda family phage portal protein n=1 Tax=Cereibacter azotoformans TaxID=43057 RepID=A0A2T5JPX3_9RHOB|nr:phage portal protein [Cereibacter azotoformans]AXQ95681.1 phage portal protein [Cereibacter sphaeroides]PTR09681.1 lambda family phage portal protein [Cereibacter azotoformans]UIJ32823.1 phage portal protein [Cereibacter azotoformans]